MEVSYIETLKSPIRRKLSYVSIYSSINEFQESRFEMEFLFGLYDLLDPNLGRGGGGEQFYSPWWFSFNNSKGKAVILAFCSAAFGKILLGTFAPNLVFLTRPSLQILGISEFRISRQSLIKGNCHNSRASDDIDMKLGTVTKIDKRNKTTLKKLTMTSFRKTVTSLPYFQFTVNLEQSGGRITDA